MLVSVGGAMTATLGMVDAYIEKLHRLFLKDPFNYVKF